jgi:hypothetical protein
MSQFEIISQKPGNFPGFFYFLNSHSNLNLAGDGNALVHKTRLTMTTITDSRHHTRELIRTFARVDECFDVADDQGIDKRLPELNVLNNRLEFLLSFPIRENVDLEIDRKVLTRTELARLFDALPVGHEIEFCKEIRLLREKLRDKLYEFLLRMDHCTTEQLFTRSITVPPVICLPLMHLNQLVVYAVSECIGDFGEESDSHHKDGIVSL